MQKFKKKIKNYALYKQINSKKFIKILLTIFF